MERHHDGDLPPLTQSDGAPDLDAAAAGRRLSGDEGAHTARIPGGANSRVYHVRAAGAEYALKHYPPPEAGAGDRLTHEYRVLDYLAGAGLSDVLPRPVACDHSSRFALYSWLPGTRIDSHGVDDVRSLLSILRRVHAARVGAEGAGLPTAVEAGTSAPEIFAQLEHRSRRLRGCDDRVLDGFLEADLEPLRTAAVARASALVGTAPLPRSLQTLSPSDIGFHNALRTAEGHVAILDFEYAGWDDPVKLTVDFLWHPAMELSQAETRAFREGAAALYGVDPGYAGRLSAFEPLYGLRFALAVLNEFIPEIWERRVFAGQASASGWSAVKGRQLDKARGLTRRVRRLLESDE